MRFLIVLLGTTLFATIEPAKLPSHLPRCYQNDRNINECFVNAANSLKQNVRSGIPEVGLRPIDPFVSPVFNLTVESPITDLSASLERFTFYRLSNYQFTSADIRPKDGAVSGTVTFSDLAASTDFKLDGHIINLPLSGSGSAKAEFGNTICDFLIDNWLEKVNCNELKLEIACTIEDLKLNFTGLPNADTTNTLLNLSSRLVASEVSPAYSAIFKTLFRPFLRRLCIKFQLDDLFPLSP